MSANFRFKAKEALVTVNYKQNTYCIKLVL